MKNDSRFPASAAASRHGFTLVELLTVVAIVAVLAAIVLVSIGKVLQSAKLAQSAGNVRQIAQGFIGYAADNRQKYPKANGNVSASFTWVVPLAPYLGPVVVRPGAAWGGGNLSIPEVMLSPLIPEGFHKDTGDYGVNDYVITGLAVGDPYPLASAVIHPGRTVIVMATERSGSQPTVVGGGYRINAEVYCYGTPTGAMAVPGTQGAARLPAGFVDGHVSLFTVDEFYQQRRSLLRLNP